MARQIVVVSAAEAGQTVAAVLKKRLSLSWRDVHRLLDKQRVFLQGTACPEASRRVLRGQRLEVRQTPPQKNAKRPGPKLVVRFADAHVVVVEKPPGLTTMRHGYEAAEFGERGRRYLPPTLADWLARQLAGTDGRPARLRAVHRLDKETSGLVVFARTAAAEKHLGQQFRAHTVERRYLAVVRGEAKDGRIESLLVEDRGDGRRGSGAAGKRAITNVRVVKQLGGYTLVECRLETGRTHQVRIHLGEAGTPICGERVYDRLLHGRPQPDHAASPRLALHAASLGFIHPATGQRVRWDAPLPADLQAFVERLRREFTRRGTQSD